MKKYSAFILALVLGTYVLGPVKAKAEGGREPVVAQEISRDEAAKKYPPPAGKGYPPGIATPTSVGGFFQSPYSSRVYDCRKIKKGALVLDDSVKKVFVRP